MSETKDNPDAILAMIAIFLKDGMDVREAVLEVGENRVQRACFDIEDGKTASETQKRLLACLSIKGRMDMNDADMEKALELTAAGWTAEDPRAPDLPPPKTIWEQTAVMSWYWRAPSKRPGRPGRRYLSTSQAWNALKRATGS